MGITHYDIFFIFKRVFRFWIECLLRIYHAGFLVHNNDPLGGLPRLLIRAENNIVFPCYLLRFLQYLPKYKEKKERGDSMFGFRSSPPREKKKKRNVSKELREIKSEKIMLQKAAEEWWFDTLDEEDRQAIVSVLPFAGRMIMKASPSFTTLFSLRCPSRF